MLKVRSLILSQLRGCRLQVAGCKNGLLKSVTYNLQLATYNLKHKTRNLQLATCLLLLTACGFQPMYGDNSAFVKNTPLAGNLKIEGIDGRYGQIFKIALEDKLNPEGLKNKSPEYRLKVSLKKNEVAAVVKSDGTIQRYNIRFDSHFSLLDVNEKVLLSGDMRRSGSYNTAVNADFAVYQAERDTSERILKELAEDYVLRLSGYFASKQ